MQNCRAQKSITVKALFLTFLISALGHLNVHAQDGEKIFKQNCTACHTITDKKLVGPGLKGVFDRVPSEEWALKWVKNNAKLRASGDEYANSIYNQYKVAMPTYEQLSDDDIKAVFSYIKSPPAEVKPKTAEAGGGGEAGANTPAKDYSLPILIGLVVVFIVLILIMGGLKRSLQSVVHQKKGLPEPEDVGAVKSVFQWFGRNKAVTAILVIIGFLWILKLIWAGLMNVGVYQGYQPAQPIAFNHKIHAGDNGIQCVYCHFGAEKGRAAGIPPANVCMNCHKYIDTGQLTGKKEIAKIYAALDYDPATGTYGPNKKPIQWVRVHNLPDLAYFNHSQHVMVGGIQCQTCHGPVQTFTTGKQFAPLTMGWCIDCHKTTPLKMANNGYYDDLHKRYHEGYFKKGEEITVDKMGGIECIKCHY